MNVFVKTVKMHRVEQISFFLQMHTRFQLSSALGAVSATGSEKPV